MTPSGSFDECWDYSAYGILAKESSVPQIVSMLWELFRIFRSIIIRSGGLRSKYWTCCGVGVSAGGAESTGLSS